MLAPTGVAADNIDGQTHHSMIPVPLVDVSRANITPSKKRMAKFVEDMQGVDYLIIDEMSMVGRRALGQIDHLLRRATGINSPFGGKSIILVGDHGQLPPVKDKRMYDLSGVRNVQTGKTLVSAPKWELAGILAYEQFTDVFFLDKIERIASGGDDAAETEKLNRFRELQLKARGGLVTRRDHDVMRRDMDISAMPTDRARSFYEPDVYALVTTRRKRDEKNMAATTALLDRGQPGRVIHAVHSPTNSPAATADDDDIGLAKTIVLARGSRVMVSWNISVPHGVVNGTVGIVVDILVKDGLETAILVAVKKTARDIPTFTPPERYDYDGNYTILAIGR